MARVCSKRDWLKPTARCAAVVVGVCGLVASAGADEVRIVARVGDMVPGGNGQQVRLNRFSGFTNASIPYVSNSGHILFTAEVTGTGVTSTNNRGLWRASPDGAIQLIARVGDGDWAPGTGLKFTALSSPMVNSDGLCAFLGTLSGSGVTTANSRSYWSSDGLTREMIVREGQDAVGYGNLDLGSISEPVWVRAPQGGGRLIFKSTLVGSGVTSQNNRALWAHGTDVSAPIGLARAGFAIDEFSGLTCKEPYRATNNNGQAILFATLMGNGIVSPTVSGPPVVPNDQLIWSPGASQPLARAGQNAPGASGMKFSSLFTTSTTVRRPQLNNQGTVLFAPTLCDASGVATGSGLWTNRGDGVLRPVVRSGDPAPGLGSGATVSNPVASVSTFAHQLCEDDSVVFACLVQGPGINYTSDRAIFRSDADGNVRLIVRGGQQAPGAPTGVVITNDSIARCWRVNARGEVAFVATLSGPGVNDSNDIAIFSTVGGTLRMVAREGDSVQQSGGWRLAGINAEPAIYFNAMGQLLFPATAEGGPTGSGVTAGWFRVNQQGEMRALALGAEVVPGQDGPQVRMNAISTFAQLSFSDTGQLAVASALMPGGDVVGESILVFTVSNSTSVTRGACCLGTACVVASPTACDGSFQGVDAACDPPENPVICCRANYNGADGLTVQDIYDYLQGHFSGEPAADFNGDGSMSVEDIFVFLRDFFTGC